MKDQPAPYSLGAHPQPEAGVNFAVWAPHADAVSVAGDFNEWQLDDSATKLERDEKDHWYGFVETAKAGSEYKFVIHTGDAELWKNDPRARALTNSSGNSIVVDDDRFDWQDDDQFELPAWNQLVIYEMHLGSFFRNGKDNRSGTFDDVIERLDHLINLGINAIELMPIAEFAGGISWGYNPAYPWAVESDYGGPDGLKRFVKACHERGIGVLLDVVYNHFGPSDLDLWQFDGWSENGLGGIYFYNDWRAKTPWGDTRPDYGRGEVRSYIRDNALMWLDRYHVDGLRFDMTFYMHFVSEGAELPDGWSLAQWINNDISTQHQDVLVIAEDLHSNEWVTKSTEAGGAGFDAQWDEQFVHPVRRALTAQEDRDRSMQAVARALTFSYNDDPFQRVIYTESHDEVANGKSRVPTGVDEYEQEGYWARKRSALGACLVMTAPAIPMIFQGQEILATGHFDDHVEIDWEGGHRHPGIVALYRDLIHLRTNVNGTSGALQSPTSAVHHLNDSEKVISYSRGTDADSDQILVVINFSQNVYPDYRVGLPQAGAWQLIFHSDAQVYASDFGDSKQADIVSEEIASDDCPASASLNLGRYDCMMFRHQASH